MLPARLHLAALTLLAFAACAAPQSGGDPVPVAAKTATDPLPLWNFAEAADAVRATSCTPGDTTSPDAAPLDLTVERLNEGQTAALSTRLPAGASLFGAWELSATDPNFGGLSGLAATGKDNTLLAVTDSGGWVVLTLGRDGPATAGLAYMRGADGKFLSGKSEGDAEGLAFRDGIALVSFERDFRIEAFDIATCGPAAKAVEISVLPDAFEGKAIDANAGPEALTLTPDGALRFGFEGLSDGVSPLGHVLASGKSEWTGVRAPNPKGFALVEMDTVRLPDGQARDIFLFRAFDPLRGARAVLIWGSGETRQLTLSRPVLTDNFEGLTAEVLPNGQLRLWIVSDDNFSDLQRTLLYAFDVTP